MPIKETFSPLAHKASKKSRRSSTRKKAGRLKGGFCEAKVLKWREFDRQCGIESYEHSF